MAKTLTKEKKEKQAAYQRERVADRKARGLCLMGACPRPVVDGRTMCRFHLDDMLVRANAYRAERLAKGLCISCGKRPSPLAQVCLICRPPKEGRVPHKVIKGFRAFQAEEAAREREKERKVLARELAKWMHPTIPQRWIEVIRLREGIVDGKDWTLQEVGELFGISRERVRQIEKRGYCRMGREGRFYNPEGTRGQIEDLLRSMEIGDSFLVADEMVKTIQQVGYQIGVGTKSRREGKGMKRIWLKAHKEDGIVREKAAMVAAS